MSLTQPFRHARPLNEAVFHETLYLTHTGWERIAPGAPYPQRAAPFFYFEWRDGLEPRGYLERRGAGRTARLETLPVPDVLHVLNAQHDRNTLIEEFRAVGGARIMA